MLGGRSALLFASKAADDRYSQGQRVPNLPLMPLQGASLYSQNPSSYSYSPRAADAEEWKISETQTADAERYEHNATSRAQRLVMNPNAADVT
jgi:hypothetical protein